MIDEKEGIIYSGKNRVTGPRLSEVAFETIFEWISAGKIQPGDWLRQEGLANELGMSQVTIREALNKLVLVGMAERIPRKGVRLPIISINDLMDIYEIRLVTEGLAWQAAAQLISKEELDEMRELLPYTGTNADPKSVEIARHKNHEFHMIAIRASGRKTLAQILTQLLNMNNYRFLLQTTPEEVRVKDGKINIQEHQALLAALENKDSDLVGKLIKDHISRAKIDRLAIYSRVIQSD